MIRPKVSGMIKALFLNDEIPLARDGLPASYTGHWEQPQEPVNRLTILAIIATLPWPPAGSMAGGDY